MHFFRPSLAYRFVPRGLGWEGESFARLRDAVGLTSMQRGIERWSIEAVAA
jgi:hypothetical protein